MAERARFTINKSEQDREGWDFLLEFQLREDEAPHESLVSLDHDLRHVKSFVQVKGTDGSERKTDIKLSNWQSLIQTPHPAYVMLVDFAGDKSLEPKHVFLRHIGEGLIRKVLLRLRKIENVRSVRERPLHKRTLRLSFRDSDELRNSTGAELRARIVETVSGRPLEYQHKKRHWVIDLGYEEYRTKVSLQPELPKEFSGEAATLVKDWSVGRIRELPVATANFYDTRFNIEKHLAQVSGGSLSVVEDTYVAATLFVSNADQRFDRYKLPVKVQRPRVPDKYLPDGNDEFRIVAPGLDIFIPRSSKHRTQITVWERAQDLNAISRMQQTAGLLNYLLELGHERVHADIHLRPKDRENMHLGSIHPDDLQSVEIENDDFALVPQLINSAAEIAEMAGIPNDTRITLSELRKQKPGFLTLRDIARAEGTQAFRLHWPGAPQVHEPEDIGFSIPVAAQLGQYFVLGVLVIYGRPEPADKGMKLISTTATLPVLTSVHREETNVRPAELIELALQKEDERSIVCQAHTAVDGWLALW